MKTRLRGPVSGILQAMFPWYENEVRDLQNRQAQTLPVPCSVRPVAFYGSSSIRLWETLVPDFSDVPVSNLGFGGSTLAACAYFFDGLIPPVCPRALVIYAGDNDLGDGQSVEQVFGSFCALQQRIEKALGNDFPFLFLSIKLSPARLTLRNAISETNTHIRNQMENRSGGYYVDLWPFMLDNAGMPRPELFAPDGLHLSTAGYTVWREAVQQNRTGLF